MTLEDIRKCRLSFLVDQQVQIQCEIESMSGIEFPRGVGPSIEFLKLKLDSVTQQIAALS